MSVNWHVLMLMLKFSFYLLITLTLSLSSCKKQEKHERPPTHVTATKIVKQTIPANFEFIGVAESSHIVELRARVEGYLQQIAYKEGSIVNEGELMFVIDPRPFEASLESAKGALASQKAILWNAEQAKARMEPLYKQNAASKKDLDDAIASVMSAEANVKSAQANVVTAELNLSFTSIAAPVTGSSNQAKYREGALISPGPNSLLTTIYVIDPIWVNFNVSDNDLLLARNETEKGLLKYPKDDDFNIEIVFADGTVMPAVGKVDFTDPAFQQTTGTRLIRAVVPNSKGLLSPGQFVKTRVKGAVRPNAIIVPQTAVQQGQKGMFVFVLDKDNKAQIRPIVAGDWYKDFWIINSGLQEGDEVIVDGASKVVPGMQVTVTKIIADQPA